jgi:hypothetical protein
MTYFLQALTNLTASATTGWMVRGDDAYANIDWLGAAPLCTEASLNAEIERLKTAEPNLEKMPALLNDFQSECQEVWVKWQLGLATESDYTTKVAEVKARYISE